MIEKHKDYHIVPRKYIAKERYTNPPEDYDLNPMPVHPREYAADTLHECEAKQNMETMFSYELYGSICPFCNKQVMMVD